MYEKVYEDLFREIAFFLPWRKMFLVIFATFVVKKSPMFMAKKVEKNS